MVLIDRTRFDIQRFPHLVSLSFGNTTMRNVYLATISCLLALSLPAQGTEWVTNGTFTGTELPWVQGGGYSVNPGLETGWDTTGMGVSDSFGVQAGGQVTPGPYAPNTIEQTITVIQGLTYEFRADVSGNRTAAPTVNNADTGTIWAEVDNVEVARVAFGSYVNNGLPGGAVKRTQLCGRFSPTTTGAVTLRISFQRGYLANPSTPRVNIDNVSVRDVYGPTYWISSNRKIGTTLVHEVRTEPNAFFGLFIAVAENPAGTPFLGVTTPWFLDLGTTTTLGFGTTAGFGIGTVNIPVPNDPAFLSTPLWYQPATLTTQIEFGYQFGVVCTQ